MFLHPFQIVHPNLQGEPLRLHLLDLVLFLMLSFRSLYGFRLQLKHPILPIILKHYDTHLPVPHCCLRGGQCPQHHDQGEGSHFVSPRKEGGFQVFRYSGIQVFKYSRIQEFKYSSIQVFKYSSIQVKSLQIGYYTLHIFIITYNVKTRDPIGSKTVAKIMQPLL